MERLDDGRADLSCADDDDLHAAGQPTPVPVRRRVMPWCATQSIAGAASLAEWVDSCVGGRGSRWLRRSRWQSRSAAGAASPEARRGRRAVLPSPGLRRRRRPASRTGSTSSSSTARSASSRRASRVSGAVPRHPLRVVAGGGEQGLLGLAFSPQYARNAHFLRQLHGARPGRPADRPLPRRAERAPFPAARQQLLTLPQPYANHNGGHLAFGPDGKLWVGHGRRRLGRRPREPRAGSLDARSARCSASTSSAASPTPELVAVGLRNPWRYTFDRSTGDLWIGDVGQSEIEEVDRLPRGRSAGSSTSAGTSTRVAQRFEDKALGPGRLSSRSRSTRTPAAARSPAATSTAGSTSPRLAGRYVFGDYCSGTIWSIPVAGGAPRVEPVQVEDLTRSARTSRASSTRSRTAARSTASRSRRAGPPKPPVDT